MNPLNECSTSQFFIHKCRDVSDFRILHWKKRYIERIPGEITFSKQFRRDCTLIELLICGFVKKIKREYRKLKVKQTSIEY